MKLPEHRGVLVGALVVVEGDEVLAMTAGGGVIRTTVTETELQRRGRDTMGVRLIALKGGDAVVGVARNAEAEAEVDDADETDESDAPEASAPTTDGEVGDAGPVFLAGNTQPDGEDEPDGGNDEGTER